MKKIVLRCIGTGDAFGTGGRFNSCYLLQAGDECLLIDCGCSSLIGLHRDGIDPASIDTIVVSHLHGDHFGGIPFLLLDGKYVSKRQRPLTLIGPPGLQHQVETALEALYPGTIGDGPGFELRYRTLDPAVALQEGGFSIRCRPVKHGGSPHVYGVQIAVAGKRLAYTGDTEWTAELLPLAAGSELLIAECFAYDVPTPSHLDYQTLKNRVADLGCKKLVLTHLGVDMLQNLEGLEFDVLNDGDLLEL